MKENELICANCGAIIDTDDYETINGEIYCSDCIEHEFVTCDCCGTRILADDAFGDDYTNLCSYCYHNRYTRCSSCDALLYEDDAYHLNGEDYCRECYDEECDKCKHIHDYGYKPEPKFFGKYSKCGNTRYFGVELEIDGAGKDDDYAGEILEVANSTDTHRLRKLINDGSIISYLDDLEAKVNDTLNRQVQLWKKSDREYQTAVAVGDTDKHKGLENCFCYMARESVFDCMIYI